MKMTQNTSNGVIFISGYSEPSTNTKELTSRNNLPFSHVKPLLPVLLSYPDMFVKPAHYVFGWLDMKFNIWHKAVADTEKRINNKKVPCGLEAFSCEHEGKHLL